MGGKINHTELLGNDGGALLEEYQSTRPAEVVKDGDTEILNVRVMVEGYDLVVYAGGTYKGQLHRGKLGFVTITKTATGYALSNLTATEIETVSGISLEINRIEI